MLALERGAKAEEAEALARKLVVATDLAQSLEAELKTKTTNLVSLMGAMCVGGGYVCFSVWVLR